MIRLWHDCRSPPHTRGKCKGANSVKKCIGIIPAYAGKIALSRSLLLSLKDHPRIRGENVVLRPEVRRVPGSPPHTRGKSVSPVRREQSDGITPAYAGKISTTTRTSRGGQDHPRIRGENAGISSMLAASEGSPPHTRGKCAVCFIQPHEVGIPPHTRGKFAVFLATMLGLGITPAYAGKML